MSPKEYMKLSILVFWCMLQLCHGTMASPVPPSSVELTSVSDRYEPGGPSNQDIEQQPTESYSPFICPQHHDLDKWLIQVARSQKEVRGQVAVSVRTDRLWAMRQYLSWVGKGLSAGGIVFLLVAFSLVFAVISRLQFNLDKAYYITGGVLGGLSLTVPICFLGRGPNRLKYEVGTDFNFGNEKREYTVVCRDTTQPVYRHMMGIRQPPRSDEINSDTLRWVIDLRDETHEELTHLLLTLPKNQDIHWRIAFRENNAPVDPHVLDTDVFQEITHETLLKEMARGRKVFVLEARSDQWFYALRRFTKHLFQLEFALGPHPDAPISPSLTFHCGDEEIPFPPIFMRVSKTLQHFAANPNFETMLLPDEVTPEDKEILDSLARYWEAATFTPDDTLRTQSTAYKQRMLQLVDFLGLERGLDKFLGMCLVPSCGDKVERANLLLYATAYCGPEIQQCLSELLIK